jgi:hypothetical protein
VNGKLVISSGGETEILTGNRHEVAVSPMLSINPLPLETGAEAMVGKLGSHLGRNTGYS